MKSSLRRCIHREEVGRSLVVWEILWRWLWPSTDDSALYGDGKGLLREPRVWCCQRTLVLHYLQGTVPPWDATQAHPPRRALAASRIGPIGRKPMSKVCMHETRRFDVDYTEEQAQWKHGYLGRGTARSSELLHGGDGRENDATYWLVGGKRLAELPG